MTEKNARSYEERIAQCPIHNWTNVDTYISRSGIPEHLRRVFHEIVLARGEAPRHMNGQEIAKFGKTAVKLTQEYKITPLEGQSLILVFEQLIAQWIDAGVRLN
jgi:hypothetical protein